MTASCRLVTLPAWTAILLGMETNDPTHPTSGGDSRPGGLLIGARLRELAQALGLNQRQLALRAAIDPRHFNAFWNDARPATFEIITKVAKASGRSIGWVCGEEGARPVLGTADAHGRLTMPIGPISSGVILFVDSTPAFAAGTRLFVDPSDTYTADAWLVLRVRDTTEAFVAYAHREAGLELLHRADGEVLRYQATRHEVVGVISGMLVPPPKPQSA